MALSGHLLVVACAAVLAAPAPPAASEADKVEELFRSLYGDEVEQAAKTRDTADDVALAARLLTAAKGAEANPALLALLCEKACQLGAVHPKGYETALAAADLLAANVPERAPACRDTVVTIRQRQYDQARGAEKTTAGEALLDCLVDAMSDEAHAGGLDSALNRCRQALTVARAIRSPNAEGMAVWQKHLLDMREAAGELPRLKEQLETDPGNRPARQEIMRLYLVELDNPQEAARYVDGQCDADTQKYVPAAAKGIDQAPERACTELAQWYVGLAKGARPGAKASLLARAKAYSERFLAAHPAQDKDRADATVTLTKIDEDLKQLGAAAWTPPARLFRAGQWIDLLKVIDVQKDALTGGWRRQAEGVASGPAGWLRLALPVVPSGGYELELKFTKTEAGGNSMFTVLPVGNTAVALFWSGGRLWLDKADGGKRMEAAESKNRINPKAWEGGVLCALSVRVALAGDQATVVGLMDGETHLHWTGPAAALSLPERLAAQASHRPELGEDYGGILYRGVRLRMLPGGKAIPVRPLDAKPDAAPPPAAPPPSGR